MTNSRLIFIELIKNLYQLSCSKGPEDFRSSCCNLFGTLHTVQECHLLPLGLLPTTIMGEFQSSTELEKWYESKVRIAKIFYIFLARIMYSSEVANIYNCAEYKQGLEMCHVQFPYDIISNWLENIDFNEHEVLNDYFYFILNPEVHAFSSADEYSSYQEKIKTNGFPLFDRQENPIAPSLLHKIQKGYEDALNTYRGYIHANYPKIEYYFEGYGCNVRIYIASRSTNPPREN